MILEKEMITYNRLLIRLYLSQGKIKSDCYRFK